MDEHDKRPNPGQRTNIFDIYGAKPRRARDAGSPPPPEEGYYAFSFVETDEMKGGEEWFRLHGEIEGQYTSIEMVRYSDIARVYCPVPELLAIMSEYAIYTLEGRNLDYLLIPMQDRKLRALYLFDPTAHPEPGEHETVILRMQRDEIGGQDDGDSV